MKWSILNPVCYSKRCTHHAVLSDKNWNHHDLPKTHMGIFFYDICTLKFTWYCLLGDRCWSRRVKENRWYKIKILIWLIIRIVFINVGMKMFCNYEAKKIAIFSLSKLWTLKDFKIFFKHCIFVASGRRTRNKDKLEPVRNVLEFRISIYKWISSMCLHDSWCTVT